MGLEPAALSGLLSRIIPAHRRTAKSRARVPPT
jgi:hypothetical protein